MSQLTVTSNAVVGTEAVLSAELITCGEVRQYLDSKFNNIFIINSREDIARHLDQCENCSRSLKARLLVQQALRGRIL